MFSITLSITLSITISTFHNAWHGLTSLENIGLNNVWLLLPTLCQFLFLKNLILSNHQHFTSPWLLLKLKSLINFTSFINFKNLGNTNCQWQNIIGKAKSNQIKSVSRHAKRFKQPSIANANFQKNCENSACADGGPRSRVCARETLRLAPHRH